MRRLYSFVLILLTPLIFGYFAFRGLRDRRYWSRWSERLAWRAVPSGPHDFLIHAASLGEVNAAQPLVNALLAQNPDARILLTSFTPTGSHRVSELFGNRVNHSYLPVDYSGAMQRLLRQSNPGMVIVVETELWPNFFHFTKQRGTPLVMVNARLSPSSVRGYQKWPGLIRPALGLVDEVLAQSKRDAKRFLICGAQEAHVTVAGNLKFDIHLPATLLETGELLRAGWGVQRPVLVAGSTHEADEKVIFAGFKSALKSHPDALLVLAPRHPERFARAVQEAKDAGLHVSRRSERRLPGDSNCFVVDTMGELLDYYATADVAFVGGTIADIGGHNLLEPAALGKPLLFGPHLTNVKETASRLLETGAARLVSSPKDLSEIMEQLFSHPATRDRMGRAGLDLIDQERGALDRTMKVIQTLQSADAD